MKDILTWSLDIWHCINQEVTSFVRSVDFLYHITIIIDLFANFLPGGSDHLVQIPLP